MADTIAKIWTNPIVDKKYSNNARHCATPLSDASKAEFANLIGNKPITGKRCVYADNANVLSLVDQTKWTFDDAKQILSEEAGLTESVNEYLKILREGKDQSRSRKEEKRFAKFLDGIYSEYGAMIEKYQGVKDHAWTVFEAKEEYILSQRRPPPMLLPSLNQEKDFKAFYDAEVENHERLNSDLGSVQQRILMAAALGKLAVLDLISGNEKMADARLATAQEYLEKRKMPLNLPLKFPTTIW